VQRLQQTLDAARAALAAALQQHLTTGPAGKPTRNLNLTSPT